MIKKCARCGEKLNAERTNQRYCPHCADLTEYERRDERLKSPALRRIRSKLKAGARHD